MSSFPTSLDTFTTPSSSDALNAGIGHAAQHAAATSAIEALQATVGVTGSAVAGSHDYRIAQLESGGGGSSGGYTFSVTPISGLTSAAYEKAQYFSVGTVATASGSISLQHNTPGGGTFSLSMTLPPIITGNFTNASYVSGVFAASDGSRGRIYADIAGSQLALLDGVTSDNSPKSYSFTVTFRTE